MEEGCMRHGVLGCDRGKQRQLVTGPLLTPGMCAALSSPSQVTASFVRKYDLCLIFSRCRLPATYADVDGAEKFKSISLLDGHGKADVPRDRFSVSSRRDLLV